MYGEHVGQVLEQSNEKVDKKKMLCLNSGYFESNKTWLMGLYCKHIGLVSEQLNETQVNRADEVTRTDRWTDRCYGDNNSFQPNWLQKSAIIVN